MQYQPVHQIKTFSAWTELGLASKVNSWLYTHNPDIIMIDYKANVLSYSVLIWYKNKPATA